MTPKKLFSEIKQLADKRYQYKLLPKKLQQLKCLETPANKMSFLRDLSQIIGITLKIHEHNEKEIILENDSEKLRQQLSTYINNQRNQGQQSKGLKKKGQQQ